MNKLKLFRFLFVLAIVLSALFAYMLFFVAEMQDNSMARIGLWCGLISQIMQTVISYFQIKEYKKE